MAASPTASEPLGGRTLRVSRALETRQLPDGVRLVKQTDRGRYLALSPAEQQVFDRFQTAGTVQDVLRAVLAEGGGLRVRPLYELVGRALDAGCLEEPGAAGGETLIGHSWPLGGSPRVMSALALVLILAGVATFRAAPLALPAGWSGWLEAGGAAALATSLGSVLAASALAGSGRQVYRPRLGWTAAWPALLVDGRDAFMGGRGCEVAVALQRLAAPCVVGALAASLGRPAAVFGSLVAALVASWPFGDSPAHALVHALFRRQHQLPRAAPTFLHRRLITQSLRFRERLVEGRYLLLHATYAFVWMVGLGRLASRCLHTNAAALVAGLHEPAGPFGDLAAAVGLGVLVAALAAPLAFVAWIVLRAGFRAVANCWFPAEAALQRPVAAGRPTPDELVAFLESTLLFGQLPPSTLRAVAAELTFTTVAAGTTIIRQGDLGDVLCVLFTGAAEVLQENESGETLILTHLGPGDVCGEIALLERVPRTSTVRCTAATSLLVLARPAFDRLLVATLGAEAIRTTVQTCAFLRRQPLFADWPAGALLQLAGRFTSHPVAVGESLIRAGEPNAAFWFVRSGRFEVRIAGQTCNRLGPGDFCGEISLLQGGPATADVVAIEPSTCLRLGRDDFLDCVSQDVLTGLLLEETATARLRRAVPA